jgi:hypothetical protein
MVISSAGQGWCTAEAVSLACGGTGPAAISQLADLAIYQGPVRIDPMGRSQTGLRRVLRPAS